jgi:hypothetical protein
MVPGKAHAGAENMAMKPARIVREKQLSRVLNV